MYQNKTITIKKHKDMTKPFIKGVEILGVDIDFYCVVDSSLYDLGAVTLEFEGRNFILDVKQSYTNNDNNHTTISCELEVDTDTFEIGTEYNYQLTASDLHQRGLNATIFIGDEFEVEPEDVTLFVRFLNDDGSGMTKAIDLEF